MNAVHGGDKQGVDAGVGPSPSPQAAKGVPSLSKGSANVPAFSLDFADFDWGQGSKGTASRGGDGIAVC